MSIFSKIENIDIIQNIAKHLIKNRNAKRIYNLRVTFLWNKDIDTYLLHCQKEAKKEQIKFKIWRNIQKSEVSFLSKPKPPPIPLFNSCSSKNYRRQSRLNQLFSNNYNGCRVGLNIDRMVYGIPLYELLPDLLYITNEKPLLDIYQYLVNNSHLLPNYNKHIISLLEDLNLKYCKRVNCIPIIYDQFHPTKYRYCDYIAKIIILAIKYLYQTNSIDYTYIIISYFNDDKFTKNQLQTINYLIVDTITQFSVNNPDIKNKYIPIITQFNNRNYYTTSYLSLLVKSIIKLKLLDKLELVIEIKHYYHRQFNTLYQPNYLENGEDIPLLQLCDYYIQMFHSK